MKASYYDMIFKRKSFHVFKDILPLSKYDIQLIEKQFKKLQPLLTDIKVEFRIVEKTRTSCKRGEYVILIYSEVKEKYLQNIGYLGEQLDLWLATQNIGVCWYGVGNPTESNYNGLDFVIMLAIAKTNEAHFRKDYKKAKRKGAEDIWRGESFSAISDVIRFAPSACNTQPWLIKYDKNRLFLYKIRGKRGIMPQDKVSYYNTIDIGIMMCFLDICLEKEKLIFEKELYNNFSLEDSTELNAIYTIIHPMNLDSL